MDLDLWSSSGQMEEVSNKCGLILRWFLLYATSTVSGGGLAAADASAPSFHETSSGKAAESVKRTSISLDAVVRGAGDVFLSRDFCELESRRNAGLSYKALSRLAHDLGLVPYICSEQRLYRC